ncbi:putative cyclin-D1-binding protein 1 [Penaeus vannamei]|uniref:Putative cyclin-D1-binding protein 1 n=1 Tax=Penaeus vannamei TaxID=6689 RepID=A0A3R7PQB0_PENVA|nr:putative cyclin-D1-binding protein 1 [Penaeus vannamei]
MELKGQNAMVSDAFDEITEALKGDGSGWDNLGDEEEEMEDEEDEKWSNEDKDLIGPSVNLIKAAKILYKRVIDAVEKNGSSDTHQAIKELDQLHDDCKMVSKTIDTLILELYPPLNVVDMEEQFLSFFVSSLSSLFFFIPYLLPSFSSYLYSPFPFPCLSSISSPVFFLLPFRYLHSPLFSLPSFSFLSSPFFLFPPALHFFSLPSPLSRPPFPLPSFSSFLLPFFLLPRVLHMSSLYLSLPFLSLSLSSLTLPLALGWPYCPKVPRLLWASNSPVIKSYNSSPKPVSESAVPAVAFVGVFLGFSCEISDE